MRVLGRIRLSRLSDESTSPERQREIIENWASANNHEIIGWAEDMDVSGSVDPFETPALGPWFREDKRGEWDILCSWKLDRVSRRAIPMGKLFGWLLDHDKILVCAADSIDLSTPMGRLIAYVIATIAEGELEAIRERATGSHRKLRELGRWPGGKPAYGYRAQEREESAGWELVPDEHASTVLESIIGRVLEGHSIESIAKDLTSSGELSPADYLRHRAGEPIRAHPWIGQSIYKMLRSKTLLGHVTHDGVTVRDAEGVPVRKGPGLVTQERYDRLQAELESRSFEKTRNRTSKASPLLGVAVCKVCDSPLHFRGQTMRGKLYRYYYCRDLTHRQQIQAEIIEKRVEQTFLEEVGTENVRERVYIQAETHQTELEEANRAVDELTALVGTMTSDTMRTRLTEQLRAIDLRIAQLETQPTREAGWEYRSTDQTYQQAWDTADTEGRRQLLLKSGITAAVKLHGKTRAAPGALEFELRIPEDVRERLSV